MTVQALSGLAAVYVLGLVLLRRARYQLVGYLWSAFGLATLGILWAQLSQWNVALGRVEAGALVRLFGWTGLEVGGVERSSLIVTDPAGWSMLNIGLECSTLVESFIFAGLLLFYPRFTAVQRAGRLATGLAAIFAVNLIRLAIIIGMIMWLGKPGAVMGHAVVGRLVFFAGMILVYWQMLTLPTLQMVRQGLQHPSRTGP